MTDVLLTHSYHLPYDRKQVRKMQPYPPLGTLYAASVLREQGFSVAVFDTMLQPPEDGFPEALKRASTQAGRDLRRRFQLPLEDVPYAHARGRLRHDRDSASGGRSGDRAWIRCDRSPREYLERGLDYVLLGEAEWTLDQLAATADSEA